MAATFYCNAQILAGEEIENQFGARLGLSTLAAAGLGNLLSDICGLGLADQIEVRATALPKPRMLVNFQASPRLRGLAVGYLRAQPCQPNRGARHCSAHAAHVNRAFSRLALGSGVPAIYSSGQYCMSGLQ